MGIFYKKILEKYVDRIPSVVYFAIVFAANFMIFLHYKTRLAYTPAWCNDFNQGPVMPIILVFGNCTLDADCNDNGTSIWKKSGLIFLQTTHFRLWKISFWVFYL